MSHRPYAYDPDSSNINTLWQQQQNRTNHLKNLSTIYKQKQSIRIKTLKDHIKRQNQLNKYHAMKLSGYDYRNKSIQDKINYQNALLRNKILQLYEKDKQKQRDNNNKQGQSHQRDNNITDNNFKNVNISSKRKSKSMFIKQIQRISPYKASQAQQMYKTNLRIGQRLTNVKSQVGALCGLSQHVKRSEMLLEMIQKKSPKKRAYLKSLTRKKFFCDLVLPQLELTQQNSFN